MAYTIGHQGYYQKQLINKDIFRIPKFLGSKSLVVYSGKDHILLPRCLEYPGRNVMVATEHVVNLQTILEKTGSGGSL